MSPASFGRVRLTAIFAAAFSLAASLGMAQSSGGGTASIARAFLDEARLRADEGDWAGAASLVTEAEQNDGTDSDIHYLAGLALLRTGAAPGASIGELDAAIAANRFVYYGPRDALSLKAELLVREGRFAVALEALQGLAGDADLRWIRCRAFLGLGDRRAFDDEISAALADYPEDIRFPRAFLEFASSSRASVPGPDETALGRVILSRLASYAALDPEMPVFAAPIMPDPSARRDAVLAYRSAGGKSAAATLLALEYGIIDEKTACTELFSGSYALHLSDLTRALDLARNESERAEVGSSLDRYRGGLVVDANAGVDERVDLVSGRARAWTLQYDDERGRITCSVSLSDEQPQRAAFSLPGAEIQASYGSYPYCLTMTFTDSEKTREYRFAPGVLVYAPLKMSRLLGQGKDQRFIPTASDLSPPTETACMAAALAVLETPADGSERRITSLDGGIPQRRETWRDGRLYAILEYRQGRPTLEKVDSDGDGRFETERSYSGQGSDAAVTSVRIDTKSSGIFDYREQLVPPYKKEWDFNDDGLMDAQQQQQPDGSLLLQFSTRLDGRFDESITLASGTILSVTRDGIRPALSADKNPLVTWIGDKPYDLGSNVPAGEGVFTVMNRRIRIVHVGSQIFSELVP